MATTRRSTPSASAGASAVAAAGGSSPAAQAAGGPRWPTRWVEVTAASNPWLLKARRLLREPLAYRSLGVAWAEGEHLLLALQARQRRVPRALCSAQTAQQAPMRALIEAVADEVLWVPDALYAGLGGLPATLGVGAFVPVPPLSDGGAAAAAGAGGSLDAAGEAPAAAARWAGEDAVLLDALQDAGNVGSILRSAAALGVPQVIALKGTAGLWSAKVLRAAMGAQFGLRLVEGCTAEDALALRGQGLVATSSHAQAELGAVALPQPCSWVFGNEGRGVSDALLQQCAVQLRIPQPGGEESLNVAAAAAICLWEGARQRAAR